MAVPVAMAGLAKAGGALFSKYVLPYLGQAAAGALVGGYLSRGKENSGVSNAIYGREGQQKQFSTYTPQMQQLQNMMIANSMKGLSPGGGLDFGPVEQRARSQFAQNTIPTIAERFSSMGQNSLSSPALYSQLGGAGAGLEEALAAQRSGFEQRNLLGLSQTALNPSFENAYIPRQRGLLETGASAGMSYLAYYLMGLQNQGQGQDQGQQQTQQSPYNDMFKINNPYQSSGLFQQAGGLGAMNPSQSLYF